MARVKFLLLFFFFGLACSPALPAFSQDANPLPNAPVPAHASETKTFRPSRWYGVVDPGERVPPLPPKDKIVFWLHEEITPVSLVPSFTSAGYAQLRNGDPQYGSDSAGFGERLGAAALREASMRFFSDSLLPTVLRTDPRYYRMGSGRFGTRAGYALERLFLTQNDSGHRVVNYSDIVGRLGASGLAMTYYPQPSVSASVVFKTWGTSLAGAEANNVFLEFWPDIRDAVFHHNRRSRPGQKAIDAATKDSDQK